MVVPLEARGLFCDGKGKVFFDTRKFLVEKNLHFLKKAAFIGIFAFLSLCITKA